MVVACMESRYLARRRLSACTPVFLCACRILTGAAVEAKCATCSGPLQRDCALITRQQGLQDHLCVGPCAPRRRRAAALFCLTR
ncbi:hypothetical protein EYF80_000025 [Liparis tanakae]|uniref:Uncharacterized protein n=1 Tax=Liparis tanakae TaxID=230148 RepID=A0A4Z2JJL0_9TELE|nr:hypothetical protein EYF80_000025 [Liparis tanakae]